jgi:hypothetical protein
MFKLITETIKGVLTYTIVDGSGNKVAGAHRVHKGLNKYSLVIPGRPPVLRGHDDMVELLNATVVSLNTSH